MISVENVLSDEESPTSPKYRPSATEKDFFSRSEDDNNNKNVGKEKHLVFMMHLLIITT
jgi:hypothetical protein